MVPVFDIEAVEWVLPVAVGFFDGTNYHEFLKVSDSHDVIWEFLQYVGEHSRGIRLYAHNAANYDNKFILESLTKHGQTVRFVAGMGKLVWVENRISFEDSYQLLGKSLAASCQAFDVPRKLDWEHSETKNPWEMQGRLDAFRMYLKRDCMSLSDCIDAFSRILLDQFGITPSSTLALTAMKAFDKGYFAVQGIAANEEFKSFIRQATYGGRNEVYRRYGENLLFYDVRRMFMSCYDVPVPVGKMHWIRPNLDRGTLAEAIVKVPDMPVGPLPYRYRGRLLFPIGELKGWWDILELRNAEKLGCRVTLTRQLECSEEPVLREFGEHVGKLGEEANEDLSRIWKLFGLRLSGKFGQHRLRTEIKHVSELSDQTGYYPLDTLEIYHETPVHLAGHRSPYIKPAVNMRIRAEARVRHLQYLLGAGTVYYCDTDSVYTDREQPIGTEPGTLRLVGRAERAYFVGCKFYGYITDGVMRQKTAGFRDFQLSEHDFRRILRGGEIPHTFKTLSDWKKVLEGQGISLVERTFTFRQPSFRNRIVSGEETHPIRLPLD